jgi:hypothetical protein
MKLNREPVSKQTLSLMVGLGDRCRSMPKLRTYTIVEPSFGAKILGVPVPGPIMFGRAIEGKGPGKPYITITVDVADREYFGHRDSATYTLRRDLDEERIQARFDYLDDDVAVTARELESDLLKSLSTAY